jgi:aspartate-semialdehyde dehydrogenase
LCAYLDRILKDIRKLVKKEAVAILGATGGVGQWLLHLLQDHPYYNVVHLAASEKNAGKNYVECVEWIVPFPFPERYAQFPLHTCESLPPCRLIFSALPSSVSDEIETKLVSLGYVVFSNSSSRRLSSQVPLIVPEVNGEELAAYLETRSLDEGCLVKNPNCCVAGLAVALKPLHVYFGISALQVTTMQATSGAGITAQKSMPIADNVIPFIAEEEEKIAQELPKVLGTYSKGEFTSSFFPISAQCNRVHVSDGHLACVSVKLQKNPSLEELCACWEAYCFASCVQGCPTLPQKPLRLLYEPDAPQPKKERMEGQGMTVSVGRVRKCSVLDFKFTLLSHNMVRGSAGIALLNAELYTSMRSLSLNVVEV